MQRTARYLEAESNTVATDENLATTNLQQSASNAVTSDKRNTNFDQMTIEVEGGSHLGKAKIFCLYLETNLGGHFEMRFKNYLCCIFRAKTIFSSGIPRKPGQFTHPGALELCLFRAEFLIHRTTSQNVHRRSFFRYRAGYMKYLKITFLIIY